MKFRSFAAAAAIAALPFAAHAATIVVPAAGTGPGANGSQWQSELTLHTSAPRPVVLALSFHQLDTVKGPVAVTLDPRNTISIADVVKTKFGVESGSGAIVIEVADRDARSVAITSRTFNVSAEGELGQDIPAVSIADASRAGDVTVLAGPSNVATSRFNTGVYAVEPLTVRWELLASDGTVTASREIEYVAGEHAQYNFAVPTLFGGHTPADNQTLHARVLSGKAIFYGSIVNVSGDPTFVPGIRTREDVIIHFAGIDLDEDGTADITDADGDGVLDAPLSVVTSLFASYFRLIATGEFGEAVEFEIVSAPGQTDIIDTQGTVRLMAAGDLKNQTKELVVRATTGNSSSLFTIPVSFR